MQTQPKIIDCSQRPNPPDRCSSENYVPRNCGFTGCLSLPSNSLCLYKDKEQTPGYILKISEVIRTARRMPGKKLLPAYVADAMLEDYSRIPKSWGEVHPGEEISPYIVFAGTVFANTKVSNCKMVRVLTKGSDGDWYSLEYYDNEKCMRTNWYVAMIRTWLP